MFIIDNFKSMNTYRGIFSSHFGAHLLNVTHWKSQIWGIYIRQSTIPCTLYKCTVYLTSILRRAHFHFHFYFINHKSKIRDINQSMVSVVRSYDSPRIRGASIESRGFTIFQRFVPFMDVRRREIRIQLRRQFCSKLFLLFSLLILNVWFGSTMCHFCAPSSAAYRST